MYFDKSKKVELHRIKMHVPFICNDSWNEIRGLLKSNLVLDLLLSFHFNILYR